MKTVQRFVIIHGGKEYHAKNWKNIRATIRAVAKPLIMSEMSIWDLSGERTRLLIIRRDNGRAKIVRDGGRGVLAGLMKGAT